MEELYLSKNALTGSLKLELMPRRMRILKLDGNLFSGTVDLTCISATMAEEGELDLSKNLLEGEIRFGQHIPSEVALSDNAFTTLEIRPEQWREVRFIELRNNKIIAEVFEVGKLSRDFFTVDLRGNAVGGIVLAEGDESFAPQFFYDAGDENQRAGVFHHPRR